MHVTLVIMSGLYNSEEPQIRTKFFRLSFLKNLMK